MSLLKHMALCFSFQGISCVIFQSLLWKKTENIQILSEIYLESLETLLNTEIQRPPGCSISTVGLSPLQYPKKKKSPTSLSSSSAAEPIQHILCNSNPNLAQLSIKILIDYSSHICLVTGPPKRTELGVEPAGRGAWRSQEGPGDLEREF